MYSVGVLKSWMVQTLVRVDSLCPVQGAGADGTGQPRFVSWRCSRSSPAAGLGTPTSTKSRGTHCSWAGTSLRRVPVFFVHREDRLQSGIDPRNLVGLVLGVAHDVRLTGDVDAVYERVGLR